LAGTKTIGLVYMRQNNAPKLQAYFDASFADNPEMRSTAGWVYQVHGAVVAYDSHTIKRVVTSSTEAECAALTVVGKENTWQRRVYAELMDLQDLQPTAIHGDNTACISLLASGVTKRSRHFSIEWFKVKDLVEAGEMTVKWVPTEDNLADFFTKKLPRERFQLLRDKIMGGEEQQDYFKEGRADCRVVCSMLRVQETEWAMQDSTLMKYMGVSPDHTGVLSKREKQECMEFMRIIYAKFGPCSAILPWMPTEVMAWQGPWLLRNVSPRMATAIVQGKKPGENMAAKDWVSWGIQGHYLCNPQVQASKPRHSAPWWRSAGC
jgi:hypothetical protein